MLQQEKDFRLNDDIKDKRKDSSDYMIVSEHPLKGDTTATFSTFGEDTISVKDTQIDDSVNYGVGGEDE